LILNWKLTKNSSFITNQNWLNQQTWSEKSQTSESSLTLHSRICVFSFLRMQSWTYMINISNAILFCDKNQSTRKNLIKKSSNCKKLLIACWNLNLLPLFLDFLWEQKWAIVQILCKLCVEVFETIWRCDLCGLGWEIDFNDDDIESFRDYNNLIRSWGSLGLENILNTKIVYLNTKIVHSYTKIVHWPIHPKTLKNSSS
jgi:hypothetical protein